MGYLDGRVAIVTGAGAGLGRAHALRLAHEGAAVVVNDVEASSAVDVVDEIHAAGGRAVAAPVDIGDWDRAGDLVKTALDAFGDLHVLVNNAGVLRDRTLARMSAAEWDTVVRIHLGGSAAASHHALGYWRERARAGVDVHASVVHTSSVAGYAGNVGQANYASAKLGLLALSRVISLECGRHGVRSNVVAPAGRTAMTLATPGAEELLAPPPDPDAFDPLDPANVSPLVAWLSGADCPSDSQVYFLYGSRLQVLSLPRIEHSLETEGRWTIEQLGRELPPRFVEPLELEAFGI